jgi:hypothetical protein
MAVEGWPPPVSKSSDWLSHCREHTNTAAAPECSGLGPCMRVNRFYSYRRSIELDTDFVEEILRFRKYLRTCRSWIFFSDRDV